MQIRSECFDTPKQMGWNGKKIQIPAGRVHGYQVEIDPDVPRKRLWSAGLYDEARRGWLYPSDGEKGPQGKAFSEQGLRIFKPQDWNHVRVEAIGDSIKTWLNGTPCADIKDGLTPRGFIALQVHGIKDDQARAGTQVRWRNLRLQEMATTAATAAPLNTLTESEKAAGWRLLWDGKTSEGWRSVKTETFPDKKWEMADGIFTVRAASDPLSVGRGSIITRERFSSFELVADFKLASGANSGIKYFVQSNLDPENKTGAGPSVGCEFQLLDDERHPDAKLGRDGNRTLGSLYDLIPPAASKKSNPVGEWNTARILVQGRHVEHWLNGQKVLEYERGSTAFRAAVAQSKFNSIPGFRRMAGGSHPAARTRRPGSLSESQNPRPPGEVMGARPEPSRSLSTQRCAGAKGLKAFTGSLGHHCLASRDAPPATLASRGINFAALALGSAISQDRRVRRRFS